MKPISDNAIRFLIVLIFTALFSASCGGGGQGTTIVGNPSVTIGQMDDSNRTLISIELGAFGDSEADLEGATIDIILNGETVNEGLDASDYYSSSSGTVRFYLSHVSEGDEIIVVIHRNDGRTVRYSGTVSASGDTVITAESVDEETALEDGFEALQDRDLAGAQSSYCAAYDSGSTNGNVAFGCFLATALALPETSEAAEILASLGSTDDIDAFEEVIDPVLIGEVDESPNCVENLDNLWSCVRSEGLLDVFLGDVLDDSDVQISLGTDIVSELVASGTSVDEFQDEITALTDDFEYLEELLETARDDAATSFTIPGELFDTDDHTAINIDAQLLLSGVQLTIVGLDIFASYDYGVDVNDIYDDAAENVDAEILVADLNGEGRTVNGVAVDSKVFLTLENEDLVQNSESRFIDALNNMIEGLQALDDGSCSDIFGGDCEDDDDDLIEEISHFEDMLSSVENGTPYTDSIPNLKNSRDSYEFTADLREFFANPPSATDVTSSDPFVYEDGKAVPVEAWFREFLDGIAEFE